MHFNMLINCWVKELMAGSDNVSSIRLSLKVKILIIRVLILQRKVLESIKIRLQSKMGKVVFKGLKTNKFVL